MYGIKSPAPICSDPPPVDLGAAAGDVVDCQIVQAPSGSGTRLVPNVRAAANAAMPRAAPRTVLRTGTALLPRPGSRAIRVPATSAGGIAPPVKALARNEPRSEASPSGARTRAARHAGYTDRSSTTATTAAAPATSADASTETPGDVSTLRARPSGVSRDAATATMTPTNAAAAERTAN